MSKYGQYCPVARALDILGDRWTLLIVLNLLHGLSHFNDLERGLPRIPKSLLAHRLRQLQQAAIIEKRHNDANHRSTEYHLTQAGMELRPLIEALGTWGEAWAFSDPVSEELNPILLMWWMRNQAKVDRLPTGRVVIQYDFHGAETASFWLVLTRADVTLCLTDPGYEINLLVTADLATYFKLWRGRISYQQALDLYGVMVEGIPTLTRAFPAWFGWDKAAVLV